MCLSDEEVITVGSTAYNLAGDVEGRGNFLKNTVLGLVYSERAKEGIGAGIVNTHLAGPATTYTRFNNWAETSGYNAQVGNLNGWVYSGDLISDAAFVYLVPVKATHNQRAITTNVGALDLHLIALEWIINNDSVNRYKTYTATLESTGGLFPTFTGRVQIDYTLGGTAYFTPAYDLSSNMPYVYLYHEERLKVSEVITDTGWIEATPPAKVGFTGSPITVAQVINQDKTTTTVVTYSDSTPSTTDEVVEVQNLPFDKITGTYTKVTNVPATPSTLGVTTTLVQSEESFYKVLFTTVVNVTSEVILGVTVTTAVTTVTPYLEVYWKYRQVTTVSTDEKWLPFLFKVYQKGSSVAGDALLFNAPTEVDKFFPVIPLRRDNVMVDATNYPVQYGWNRSAALRCFGHRKKYDDLIETLADNPDLNQIDHAWVVFGVSLSTQQQDGQKYLYEFFKDLADSTISALGTYKSPTAYQSAWESFVTAVQASNNDESVVLDRPLPPTAQNYVLAVSSTAGAQDWLYNTTLTAKGGAQVVGSGYHVKALGKVGQAWVYEKSSITVQVPTSISGSLELTYVPATTAVIAFGKQVTSDIWVEYEFFDLVHKNVVYQGLDVTTLGSTAITSLSENSSFLVPLHENALKDLSLVRRTQLSLECSFLVVNYYDKQTIPWYSTSFFQVVLVIIIIVIAYNTGYVAGESAGVLGTNTAVGAALGFTGVSVILAGAIANALAAMLVSVIVTEAATGVFGEKYGKIIGAVVAAVMLTPTTPNGSFSAASVWTELTKADSLIKLTLGGLNTYGGYLQSQAMELNAETQAMMLESNTALKAINDLMQELQGDTGVDPSTITNALRYASESSSQFYDRTTMTGTEIAELSIKLVEDFPAPQLTLPYPT
jgi:uncharacterized membrane protein (DUF485 family)